MKRSTIWGLAITLVLGCWAGHASARPLAATDALLLPYYETSANLATIIGVQHVAAVPTGGEVSVINVAVYDGEDGVVEDLGFICLGQDEFGFVVLQSARPTQQEGPEAHRFSVEGDGIPETGFVTLAYAGTRSSCGSGGGSAPTSGEAVMVAWATIQDIGSGFFATEIPMLEVEWAQTASNEKPARGLEPYCYRKTDRSKAMDRTAAVLTTDKTACVTPDTHTFVASGPYCYANSDNNRAVAGLDPSLSAVADWQLNDAGTGCKNPFTHTFVPKNTLLPAIPAVGPGATFTCSGDPNPCPGLATADAAIIGARFDVLNSNRSASHVYLWLSTVPPDGRETTNEALDVVCENGMMQTLTASQRDKIDISGHVTEINPSGLGCSARGVVELTLSARTEVIEKCTDPTATDPTAAVPDALDPDNNRCREFTFTADINNTDASSEPKVAGCYDKGISYSFTKDLDNDGVEGGDTDRGCYDKNAFPTPIATTTEATAQHSPAGTTGADTTGCYSRSIAAVDAAANTTDGVVTSCKTFTYEAVTADAPHGYMFSHISQADQHYRMNFPGYVMQ